MRAWTFLFLFFREKKTELKLHKLARDCPVLTALNVQCTRIFWWKPLAFIYFGKTLWKYACMSHQRDSHFSYFCRKAHSASHFGQKFDYILFGCFGVIKIFFFPLSTPSSSLLLIQIDSKYYISIMKCTNKARLSGGKKCVRKFLEFVFEFGVHFNFFPLAHIDYIFRLKNLVLRKC